jgi:hypothetical protein
VLVDEAGLAEEPFERGLIDDHRPLCSDHQVEAGAEAEGRRLELA